MSELLRGDMSAAADASYDAIQDYRLQHFEHNEERAHEMALASTVLRDKVVEHKMANDELLKSYMAEESFDDVKYGINEGAKEEWERPRDDLTVSLRAEGELEYQGDTKRNHGSQKAFMRRIGVRSCMLNALREGGSVFDAAVVSKGRQNNLERKADFMEEFAGRRYDLIEDLELEPHA